MENGKQPAFAVSKEMCEMPNGKTNIEEYPYGLTKREYFAAMAMQGMLANNNGNYSTVDIAQHSVRMADDILKRLENN
jgi:aminopeptidase-like protein